MNGQSMVNITHEEAVSILKATETEVLLQLEKNAIHHMGPFSSGDEEEVGDTGHSSHSDPHGLTTAD